MSPENKETPKPFRYALPLSVPNVFQAILDSPIIPRISFGRLSEDGKTVLVKKGAIQVDRAEAGPGEKVVVYEV